MKLAKIRGTIFSILILYIYGSMGNCTKCKTKELPPKTSKYLDEYWQIFKCTSNKTYTGKCEALKRKIWEKNIFKIYLHNLLEEAGHLTWTLRDNQLSDLSTSQYLREMLKLTPSCRRRASDEAMVAAVLHDPRDIPTHLDYRKLGFETPPANQGGCGSCYAYSIAGCIEGQMYKKTGILKSLSAQQLVDCSVFKGNKACLGGSLRNTLRYLEESRGLMGDDAYPYQAEQGTCKFQEALSAVNLTSWAILPARDERSLEAAVATIGPIAVSINASPKTFQLYHQGVYDDPNCSSDRVNHAMLVVGYTPTEWILKNWWGEDWGEGGYMRLRKNKNRCGVANYAAYAKV